MKKIEMIIEYSTDGTDFVYNDNHGVLTRCKDCKHRKETSIDHYEDGTEIRHYHCDYLYSMETPDDGFCFIAEKRCN